MEENIQNIVKADSLKIAAERRKAQVLRKSTWWKSQIGKNKCYYCKGIFHPNTLTMDHKISLIRGGKTTKKNIVPCCKNCNKKKKYLFYGEIENFHFFNN